MLYSRHRKLLERRLLSVCETFVEIGLEVNSADPLAVVELTIPMPRLPVTGAGTFSLDLMYDNEILGSWRIVVTEETIQG